MDLKSFYAKTDQGPYLNVNEDDLDVDLINKLVLLFDGFGGAGIGDESVKIIKNDIKKYFNQSGNDPDATFPYFYSPKYLIEGNALINAIKYAHQNIIEKNIKVEMSKRGGASAICVSISDPVLTFASTGSCIALLYRGGVLETISYPDSLGMMGHDDFNHFIYTSPMSGFGLFEDIHINVREVKTIKDDLILLLSDGIYSRISRKDFKFTIEKDRDNLENISNTLIELANDRGNLDNQAIVLLNY